MKAHITNARKKPPVISRLLRSGRAALFAGSALLGLGAKSAYAQDIPFYAAWNGGSGDWVSVNWSPQPIDFYLELGIPVPIVRWPDNATNLGDYVYIVDIPDGFVSLGDNVTVSTLLVDNGATLHINSGGKLTLEGYLGFEGAALNNDGLIFLTGDGELKATSSFISGGLSLLGDGEVQLAGADTLIEGSVIDIGGSQIVHGYGRLGSTLATGLINNAGDIIANVSGEKIVIRGTKLLNEDLVQATGGGQVEFRTALIENDDIMEAEAGSLLDMNDLSLENDGVIHAKTGGLVQMKDLIIDGSGALQASGTGALQFRGVDMQDGAISVASTATAQSIEGTLTWQGNGALQGVLQTAGGGLSLHNLTLNNTAGTVRITPGNGAAFGNGLTLSGGLVDGGGTVSLSGAVRFSGTTSALTLGAITAQVADGTVLNFDGTTHNHGVIQLLDSGTNPITQVRMDTAPTVDGAGQIVFASGNRGEIVTINGTTFTNGVGHTILTAPGAEGYIRTTFNNAGSIFANGTAGKLWLQNTTATNTGLLGATNGGRMEISYSTSLDLQNAGGTIYTNDAASLIVTSNTTTIRGGAISGPGTVYNQGTLILDGTADPVTITNTLFRLPATVLRLRGSVGNSGTVYLEDPSPFPGHATVQIDGTVTLGGSGQMLFNSIYGNIFGPLLDATPDLLINGLNHTITSSPGAAGTIQVPLLNHGTIDATGAATHLIMDSYNIANDGRIGASQNGFLQLNNIAVNNADGEFFAENSGVVHFNGVTVTGAGSFKGNSSYSAGNLIIDNTSGSTTIETGATLGAWPGTIQITGPLTNNGLILLADNSPFAPSAALVVNGSSALNGTGSLRFNSIYANHILNGTSGTASLFTVGSAQTVTTAPGMNGYVTVSNLINNGIFEGRGHDGTNPGRSVLSSTAITNTGVFRAIDGGRLDFDGYDSIIDNTTGTIAAVGDSVVSGSVVVIGSGSGPTIRGGLMTSSGNGYFYLQGTPTFNGIANPLTNEARQIMIGTLTLRGTIINNGIIEMNGTSSSALRSGDHATLSGTGKLQFNTNANNNVNSASPNGSALTNGPLHTITTLPGGRGIFSGPFINQGIIEGRGITSGSVRGSIILNGTQVTNTGTMRAVESGYLGMEMYGTVENVGGTISADGAGSYVHLMGNTVIRGGLLTSSNDGFHYIQGVNTFDGITSPLTNEARQIMVGTLTLRGTIINNGIIEMNGTSSSALRSGDNATLSGAGKLQFNTNANNNVNSASPNGSALINGSLHTITTLPGGRGIFSGPLINQGIIEGRGITSGSVRGSIILNGTQLTNTGTMRAVESGYLGMEMYGTVENTGGTITADGAGSYVHLMGNTVIRGGLLTSSNDGFHYIQGVNTFDGIASPLTNEARQIVISNLTLRGTIINNGIIEMNGTSSSALRSGDNATLSGTGKLQFNTNANNNVGLASPNGSALTNGPLHTITTLPGGRGIFSGPLINQGTFEARGAGSLVTINAAQATNAGIMRSVDGGVLEITGVSSFQNAGATLAVNGPSTYMLLNSSTINGGTLTGDGYFYAQGVLTLDGAVNPVHIDDDTRFYVPTYTTLVLTGGIENDGVIMLTDPAGPGGSVVQINSTQTLAGNGELLFAALGSNYILSSNSTFVLTNGSDHQIRVAAGMVGNIQPRLVNEGTLQADGQMILEGAANRNAPGGIIKGNGVITLSGSALANEGTIAPGNSAGDLDITGTVTSSNTSIYEIELGGTLVGTEFDQLRVGGSFTLDGQLEVSLINGFIPAPTDSFTIMTGTTITGLFDNVSGGRVHYDFGSFDLIQTSNTVRLQNFEIVPEPSSALLLLISSGTLLMRRRRG